MLLLLGGGVVANNILPKNKGAGTGFLHVNWGWGIAVFAGVLVSYKSGGHLNPAVTLGLVASGAKEFVPGIPVDAASIFTYIGAQMIGAMIGAVLCWLAYKKQFDQDADPAVKLGVFSTGPEVRNYLWNTVTEVLGTFVLVFVVLASGHWATRPRRPRAASAGSAPSVSRSSSSASAPPWAARPATPSTRLVTLARASCTPSSRSPARAAPTGRTHGCRSSARSSAASSQACCPAFCSPSKYNKLTHPRPAV